MSGWILECLKAGKRGPALKNRLVGDAEMHKRLLDRESLRAEDGVKFFSETLRPHFIQGAQSFSSRDFCQYTRARRGNIEMIKWIGKLSLHLKRLRDTCIRCESKEKTSIALTWPENRLKDKEEMKKPWNLFQENRDNWYATQVTHHERLFPFSDNLTTMMFIVASNLSEAQRETYQFLFSSSNECPCLYPCSSEKGVGGIVLYAEKFQG